MISSRVKPSAHLDLAALALSSMAYAAEPFRVLAPGGSAPNATVLLVPGCSDFVARNGINHYDERANELRAAGYFVVFVDYLSRRHLTDCAGGRDVSHGEVAADILEAAMGCIPDAKRSRISTLPSTQSSDGLIKHTRSPLERTDPSRTVNSEPA